MFTALLILQVLLGLTIIALVLLQQGKGADMGAAFGAGASGTVFGARGTGSFFSRATAVLAALFFINSVLLSSPLVLGDRHPTESSIATKVPVAPKPEEQPAEKAPAEPADGDLPPADLPEADKTSGEAPTPADVPEKAAEPAAGAPKPEAATAADKDTGAKKPE